MKLLLLALLALPLAVSAHGGGTPTLEAEVGEYLIDIGYDRLAVAGEEITFDLDLFTAGPPIDYATFATVELRVTKNGSEIFNGAVPNEEAQVPTMSVIFPESGGYDLDVRYENEASELIVGHTFHLEVQPPAAGTALRALQGMHYTIAGGLFALSLGIGGYSLWKRFGKR